MAIVKMQKLSAIGMNAEKKDLLKDLMDLGVVEISSAAEKLQEEDWKALVVKDGDEANVSACEKKLSQIDAALSVLGKYGNQKKPLFALRKTVTPAEYADLQKQESTYEKEMDEVLSLSEQLSEAFAVENANTAQIASLTPWAAYTLPLEEKETERLQLRLGVLPPSADLDAIRAELAGAGHPCELTEISRDKEQCYVSLWYFTEDEELILDLVKSHGYTNADLGELTGTVSANIERLEADIVRLGEKKSDLTSQIRDKASYLPDLEAYHDIMAVKRDEAKVRSSLLKTEETFTFDGWTPAVAAGKIKAVMEKYTCWYELSEPTEEDDIPVALQNKPFFAPLEFVTKMYSLPSAREIDPTAIYTFFYILFFGIMFGDVGYGLLLILLTGILLKKGAEGSAAKLLKVIFYSGFSSVFWGVLFGSYFGDLIPVVARTFFGKTITIDPLWLDPAKEPMVFLVFSCGLGVVHLFVGMGIKAYELIRAGKFLDAVNEVFAWYMIVLGLVLWLFGGSLSAGIPSIGMYLFLAGVVIALVLPIFIAKGAGKGLGIWNLYSGITGNLSDILSYSRLLGLGLASTSIAGVFNFLASMFGDGIVGIIMFLIVFLIGHGLNFAINALGAFVHSCRLQYVEFFGKFYEGGGREFAPFCKNTKYIHILEEDK